MPPLAGDDGGKAMVAKYNLGSLKTVQAVRIVPPGRVEASELPDELRHQCSRQNEWTGARPITDTCAFSRLAEGRPGPGGLGRPSVRVMVKPSGGQGGSAPGPLWSR